MHQRRNEIVRGLPLPRKGTTYVARALNTHVDAVPVVIAIRDMLNLATNAKEVKRMVNQGLIKINGSVVKDIRESVKMFGILQADKSYVLTKLPTGRFDLSETKADYKLCKVIGKTLVKNGAVQINLHDGGNLISKEKIKVGDSLEIDFSGKVKKIIPMEKGKTVFALTGRSAGLSGKVIDVENGKVKVEFEKTGKEVLLDKSHLIVQ